MLTLVLGAVALFIVFCLSMAITFYYAWGMKYIVDNFISLFIAIPSLPILFYFAVNCFLGLFKSVDMKQSDTKDIKTWEDAKNVYKYLFIKVLGLLLRPIIYIGLLHIIFKIFY